MNSIEIFKKLRLDPTKSILIVNAPAEYEELFLGISFDKQISNKLVGKYDFVQIFATNSIDLERLIKQNSKAGKYDCHFWACYPKGTGKIKSDIKRDTVWSILQLIDMQAVSQIAIDDTWSALRARPKNAVGK